MSGESMAAYLRLPSRTSIMKSEKGTSLIEVMVAMALLGIIGVTLLSGTATTSTARVTADERSAAKILAETAIEEVKKAEFDTSYSFTVPPEFNGYTVDLTVTNIMSGSLERVTAAVEHRGRVVLTLESYKSNR
jgi:prepilin-type N-terminal cleavage/methylation domain-containing protein